VETLRALQVVWKVSLALSCLGLMTRASTAGAFLLGIYLLGLPHNFGKTHHIDAVLVITLGLMALARSGDAFSLDRLLRRRDDRPVLPSSEYTWPIRAACVAYALVFFGAGYAKLSRSGPDWIFSDNMAITLLQSNYHVAAFDPPVTWNAWLARHQWMCQLVALGTVLLELAAPLALFSRRAAWVLVPACTLMLIGIRLLLGPSFFEFMIVTVFWINWEWLARRTSGLARRTSLAEPVPA
jgi:hypothetical protein